MSPRLDHIHIKNYRSLADVELELSPVTVVFGSNGAGKSSLLDTLWFVRDCFINGVAHASSKRSHGIGMLWDRAEQGGQISISLRAGPLSYELRFGFSAGRIEPMLGERLLHDDHDQPLLERSVGADSSVFFYPYDFEPILQQELREPDRPSLQRYLDIGAQHRLKKKKSFLPDPGHEAIMTVVTNLDDGLHYIRHHHCRSFDLHRLKQLGSESGFGTSIDFRGQNLWSVLRNLKDRREVDERYDTIMGFMRKAFPRSFDNVLVTQTGPNSVYAEFVERGLNQPIQASGVSDGHIQMLLLLAILFGEGKKRPCLLILDEPEISLHPWALVVLGEAIHLAADQWNKQLLVATHSPSLISQFEANELVTADVKENRTELRRVSEIQDAQDLLDEYAAGALYMAGVLAPQDTLEDDPVVPGAAS